MSSFRAPLRSVHRAAALAALAAAGVLAACVGTDPVPAGGSSPTPSATTTTTSTATGTTPGGDASLPDSAAPDGAVPDAAVLDAATDAADAAPPPPAPPVVSPNVWLDARKIPLGTTTLRTWADSSPHHADATSVTALSFSPTGLDGRPGVVFAGSYFQAVSIQAAKVPAFRASPGAGFAVFIVAAEKAVANTRAESVLFERFQAVGRFPAVRRVGLQLTRSNALGEVIAALSSYEGQQLTTEAKVRIPSLGAPHLYVVHGEGGSVTLRVDGFIARTASGFVENDFATNGSDGERLLGGGL